MSLIFRIITAAHARGTHHRLALDGFPYTALVANAARDIAVPDAASASTALARYVQQAH